MGAPKVLVMFALGACSFRHGYDPASDGNGDGVDASEVGLLCYGSGLLHVCLPALPDPTLDIGATRQIDTSTDPLCSAVTQAGGPEVCVIAAQTITIHAPVVAIGTRPLVLLATDALTVSNTLDVSTHHGIRTGAGANDSSCGSQNPLPDANMGGGGGGAGGSFGAVGGNGGTGNIDFGVPSFTMAAPGSAAAAQMPMHVRGGCPGGIGGTGVVAASEGAPGVSGGALYLIAGHQITITGSLLANGGGGGGGGDDGGGGGGGTGGLIGFDAPAISITAQITANGAGGGGGGDNDVFGGDPGSPGSDGNASTTTAASGGAGGAGGAGLGGAGGVAATSAQVGQDHVAAGGGGGGSVGVIYVKGTLGGSGQFSPAPSQH